MNTEAMEPRPAMLIASGPPAAGFTRADVGGKGWNLFRLARAGFPVPPWTVVTSGVFELVIAPHRDAIDRILRNITDDRKESLEAASSAIADLIHGTPLPPGLRREILDGPGPALSPGRRYSVRSSVIGEDSAGHSYAGLMTTRLNVPRDGIIGALREVWVSAFSARAILYRRAKGLGLSGISSAVIIQEMVTPATSGVVFSRDPERRTKECVVAAGYGLGEGVVSDAVETDSYRADWSGNEVRSSVTVKTRSVVARTGAAGGTRVVPVTGDRTFRPVLGDGQVLLLRDMAVRIEKEFGTPQDIEWAFDVEGRLFILQARPIVFPERGQDGPVRIWDNSNIVESYPGITLPLTFSFIRTCYEETFRSAAEGFVLFRSTLRPHLHIFPEMVGLIQGRVYYNLLNWYEMLSLLPGFERHRKSWDQMIGITARVPFPEKRVPLPHRVVAAAVMVFRLLDVRGNARRFFRRFTGIYERYRKADIASMDGRELAALYNELRDRLLTEWHPTLYNDFCAMKYYDWLKALCGRWLPPEHAGIHNQLLCGEEGIESVEPVHSAVRIAVTVRSTPHMRELFSGRDDREIWDAILTDPRYDTLRGACGEHLDRYGDRGTEELKLEKATLAERPEMLVALIKHYAGLGLTVEEMKARESRVRADAENAVRLNLRNPLRAAIFRFILTRARRAVANRENMRFARSRAYGLVRRIFRRLGQILAKEGLIHRASDINYLTVGEVFGIIDGTATTLNLRDLVDLRKREYGVFAKLNPAERIVTRGIPSTGPGTAAPPAGPGNGELRGTGCSSGVVRGTARVVLDPGTGNGGSGYILVARSTDPGWVFLMISSKGIIVEKGSVLSHTAIIGRELGIPTIIGVRDATSLIRDGSDVEMDGSSGRILCR